MNLLNYFEQKEIDMIIEAVASKEKHWRAIANRGNSSGKVSEEIKLEAAAIKAEHWRALESKIAEASI